MPPAMIVDRDGEFYEEPLPTFTKKQMNFEAPIPREQGLYEILVAEPTTGSVRRESDVP